MVKVLRCISYVGGHGGDVGPIYPNISVDTDKTVIAANHVVNLIMFRIAAHRVGGNRNDTNSEVISTNYVTDDVRRGDRVERRCNDDEDAFAATRDKER